MKQCALHTAAASLVRESGVLHGVRANAGFDVPLEDSCLDGVSGNLQVDAGVGAPRYVPQCGQRDSVVCETERLHIVLENLVASASVAETELLLTMLENLQWSLSLIGCLRRPRAWLRQAFLVVPLLGEAEIVGCA